MIVCTYTDVSSRRFVALFYVSYSQCLSKSNHNDTKAARKRTKFEIRMAEFDLRTSKKLPPMLCQQWREQTENEL